MNGSISETDLPIGVDTIIGSITLDVGTWVIMAQVWNPIGMSTFAFGFYELGASQLITGQHLQVMAIATPKSKTTYHISACQWGQTSAKVVTGDVKAVRIL